MRICDVFSLSCHKCRTEVSVPVQGVTDGRLRCPMCGTVHEIVWPAEYEPDATVTATRLSL
jgi:hypothetical protein